MIRLLLAWLTTLVVMFQARARVTVSVDLLDPSDGISMPPPGSGIVCVDVLVDVTDGDTFTAGGLRGVAMNGAALLYAPDPNLPKPPPPSHFITFFTIPRGRDAPNRYTNGASAAAGRYSPTGPTATMTASEINVAWFASPPPTIGSPTGDGAVFRVALRVPAGREGFVALFPLNQVPPGLPIYFESRCPNPADLGTVSATYDVPALTGLDWALVDLMPEPGSAILLALGGLTLLRRT